MSLQLSMATELGISRDPRESTNDFKMRLLLSAAAKWMLCSLHTLDEKRSVNALKNIVTEKIEGLERMLELKSQIKPDAMTDFVYDILLTNGMILHSAYYVFPPIKKSISCDEISIYKGIQTGDSFSMSGLVPYELDTSAPADLALFFPVTRYGPMQIINMVWRNASPDAQIEDVKEFQDLSAANKISFYYSNRRPQTSLHFMGRSKRSNGQYTHYILCNNSVRRIGEDYVNANMHDYCRFAIMASHELARANFQKRGGNCIITMNYKLPTPELKWLQMLSWPLSWNNFMDAWHFRIPSATISTVSSRLKLLGCKVEVQNE